MFSYIMLCCVVSWSRYQQSQRPWPKLLLCLRCQHLGFFLITFFSFDLAFAIHYHQRLGQYFKDIKYYFLLCSLVLCYVLLCCVMLCCVFVLVMLNYVILCYVVLCYVFYFQFRYVVICCVLIQETAEPKAVAKAVVVPSVPASWFFLDHIFFFWFGICYPLSPKTGSIF